MNDPNLVPQSANVPVWQLQDYGRRSPDQIAKDLTAAHDRIRTLVREADRQEHLILQLTQRDDRHVIMLWIQGGALAAIWGLVLALIFR
jgi:hypothetical protein